MTTVTLHPEPLPQGSPRHTWHPDGWCFRGVTTVLALAVSGMYAFLLFDQLGVIGATLLVGAGLAWPALLAGVWIFSAARWRFARLDWCLWTMTVGSVAMALALLLNLFTPNPILTLLGGLLFADVAMGWVLTRYALTVGVQRTTALLLWVGGMNGLLAAIVAGVWLIEGGL